MRFGKQDGPAQSQAPACDGLDQETFLCVPAHVGTDSSRDFVDPAALISIAPLRWLHSNRNREECCHVTGGRPRPPARRGPDASTDSDGADRPGRSLRAAGNERRRRELLPPRSTVQDQPPSSGRRGHSPPPEAFVDCKARIFGLAAKF